MAGDTMTPERLEELRALLINKAPAYSWSEEDTAVLMLFEEIDRLRAPVEFGDPDGFVMHALRAGGANEHTQRRTADLIARLVRGLYDARAYIQGSTLRAEAILARVAGLQSRAEAAEQAAAWDKAAASDFLGRAEAAEKEVAALKAERNDNSALAHWAGWKVRALAAEAEVAQLKAECCRCGEPTTAVCKAAQTAEAEVVRLRDALTKIQAMTYCDASGIFCVNCVAAKALEVKP